MAERTTRLWQVLNTLSWAPVLVAGRDCIGGFRVVSDDSMSPTLSTGMVVFETRLAYANRGDIVVTRAPNNPKDSWLRRIIAVRGDYVRMGRTAAVPVNIMAGSIFPQVVDKDDCIRVPKGHVWIEADSNTHSTDDENAKRQSLVRLSEVKESNAKLPGDSITFGAVPEAVIIGKVTHILWPPSRMCRIRRENQDNRILQPFEQPDMLFVGDDEVV